MARRTALLLVPFVLAATTAVIAGQVQSASAHGPFTINADSTAADATVSATDGTPLKVRMLKPTSTTTGGWPVVLYMQGSNSSRCADMAIASRAQIAQLGFAVVSFNGRGMPGGGDAGLCGDAAADTADALNDSGWDGSGPNDIQDAKDVITWALAQSGVSTSKVGVMGNSYNGTRTYLLARQDSRVDGIIALAAPTTSVVGTVDAISSHPVSEPDSSLLTAYLHANNGWFGHADPSVLSNLSTAFRTRYLNQALPSPTKTWFDARTVLDQDNAVDQAHLITTPTFVVHGFLDTNVDPSAAIETWKRIPTTTEKYLYVGACGHSAPCTSNNAAYIRGKIHEFLDRAVLGSGAALSSKVMYAVPPLVQSNDNWTVGTSNDWPPTQIAGSPLTWYLRSSNQLSTTAPSTAEAADTISNSVWANSVSDTARLNTAQCPVQKYTTGEFVQYTTTDTAQQDLKLVQLEARLVLSSSTTRLQVVADLYEVDTLGNETAVAQGVNVVVPTARSTTAGTKVTFTFRPTGNGRTIKTGHRLRLKVASNYRGLYAMEPLPATYSVWHTSIDQSWIKAYFAT